MTLSPKAKRWLMIGIPVVGVFALIMVIQRKGSSGSSAAGSAPAMSPSAPAGAMPGSVLDAGQLAQYEQGLTNAVGQLSQSFGAQLTASNAAQLQALQGLLGTGQGGPIPAPAVPQLSRTTWGAWSGDTQYGQAPGSTTAVYFQNASQADAFYRTYGDRATYFNTNWDWKTQGSPPASIRTT